jgi:hypothetical protein
VVAGVAGVAGRAERRLLSEERHGERLTPTIRLGRIAASGALSPRIRSAPLGDLYPCAPAGSALSGRAA